MEFLQEENFEGIDCENSTLRRLYRVLNLPVSDFIASKERENPDRISAY